VWVKPPCGQDRVTVPVEADGPAAVCGWREGRMDGHCRCARMNDHGAALTPPAPYTHTPGPPADRPPPPRCVLPPLSPPPLPLEQLSNGSLTALIFPRPNTSPARAATSHCSVPAAPVWGQVRETGVTHRFPTHTNAPVWGQRPGTAGGGTDVKIFPQQGPNRNPRRDRQPAKLTR
jgi:hypothetical protein